MLPTQKKNSLKKMKKVREPEMDSQEQRRDEPLKYHLKQSLVRKNNHYPITRQIYQEIKRWVKGKWFQDHLNSLFMGR